MTDDIAAYLDHLRVARRLAEHTLESSAGPGDLGRSPPVSSAR
jgi:hypothetical protein